MSHDNELVAASQPVLDWAIGMTGSQWLRSIPLRASRRSELPDGINGQTKFLISGSDVTLEILIQTPMPVIDVQETVAHELGHVLLTTDLSGPRHIGPHQLSAPEEEGFCEVLRMLWINHHGAADSDWRITRAMKGSDPVYSVGLRQMWPRFLATDRTIVGFRSSVLPGHVSPTQQAPHVPPAPEAPPPQPRPAVDRSQPSQPRRARPSISMAPGRRQPTQQAPPARPTRPRTAVPNEHAPRERPRLNLRID